MAQTPSIDLDHLINIAAGVVEPSLDEMELRTTRRIDHDADVALVQRTPTGGLSIPTVVRCRNISAGGMCIESRYMLHVGYEGAVLMKRPDGRKVMLGVKVVHCKYAGSMRHESGLEFTALSDAFAIEDFRDEQGNMPRIAA